MMDEKIRSDDALQVGNHLLRSRLIVGTGKYQTFPLMAEALEESGTHCITVAVRRERLYDQNGQNILDFIDPRRYLLLPNTAGCFTVEDAVRTARLGREILEGLENPARIAVKLEVLGDSKTLLPDPVATLQATEQLVAEGFDVLCYTTDDPVLAPQAEEGRGNGGHAGGQSDRIGPGDFESEQLADLSGVSQRR